MRLGERTGTAEIGIKLTIDRKSMKYLLPFRQKQLQLAGNHCIPEASMHKAIRISGLFVLSVIVLSLFPVAAFALDEGGWTYEVSDKGEATVTAYSGPDGSVTIPEQLDGHDVTAIGGDVFTTVNITSLTIPKGVLTIDGGAFWECRTLERIDIDTENPNYKSVDGIVFSKDETVLFHYPAAKSGASYAVPDQVATIGRCAFDHNQNLQSITLPETVTQIGDSAFWRCQSLMGLVIPKGVTVIGDAAFANCSNLAGLTADAGNPAYQTMDGVLFDSGGVRLIQCPAGKSGSYTVPEGVTTLCSGSFRGCAQLKEVVLGDGVTEIGDSVFAYCDGLENISLGSGVQKIGYIAFQGCSSLKYVKFPACVTEIADMAFDSCGSLQAAYFMGNPPVLGDNAFQGSAAGFSVYYHCSGESGWNGFADYPATPFCVIAFDSPDGSAVPEQMVKVGETVACPDPPEYPGFVLDGWYTDAACTQAWDFSSAAATEDLTLYASWTPVLELASSDADGKIGNGESFTLTPGIEGGTWSYDNDYLSLSGNTFTAVKSGAATVTYAVEGQTAAYNITIEETIEENAAAPAAAGNDAPAPTKPGFPWIAIIIAFATILLIGGLLAVLMKRKRKSAE